MPLSARAPAKVNLTLRVFGRRADGFHELDSIVAFAGCAADVVTLTPGPALGLASVDGPFAGAAGPDGDNLVLKAARAAAERIEGLRLGMFSLTKRIPVAAGLGGGSADAGAALRLIAEASGLDPEDARLVEAAAATGSDVPVCLASRASRMAGRGERIEPIDLPPVAAVLANPMRGLSTADVFRALGLAPGSAPERLPSLGKPISPSCPVKPGTHDFGVESDDHRKSWIPALPREHDGPACLETVLSAPNDLEPPARALMPEIGEGVDAIAATEGCRLARMSGSGATVFGLFDDQRAARRAARALRELLPHWWIRPSMLR